MRARSTRKPAKLRVGPTFGGLRRVGLAGLSPVRSVPIRPLTTSRAGPSAAGPAARLAPKSRTRSPAWCRCAVASARARARRVGGETWQSRGLPRLSSGEGRAMDASTAIPPMPSTSE